MIPKIDLRFSFIYNKKFNSNFNLQDFTKLKNDSRPFIELFNKYIKNILHLIETYNEPWKREYIPIYLVSGKIKSFSDPLTLRYREDYNLLLLILIHELIHNNLTKKYKNPSDAHKVIHKVYKKVLEELNLPNFEKAKEKYDLLNY